MLTDILKKIGTNTLIYSLGGILGRAIGFVMIPVYTRYLTPADYGIIELLDLTTYLIGTIAADPKSNPIRKTLYSATLTLGNKCLCEMCRHNRKRIHDRRSNIRPGNEQWQ